MGAELDHDHAARAQWPGNVPPNPDNHDGQHDFDFEFGRWKVHLKRLGHSLSGSKQWLQYDGTIVVSKIWNGRANIVEFEAKNGTGQIEGLSLRLFDPGTHQWSMWWANREDGYLDRTPQVGAFQNDQGQFLAFETSSDRWVLVRFIFSGIRRNFVHGEQSYSIDGGKTWEPNWIEDFTRD
ncbi:MAG: hypothetical protein JOZ36_13855 [Acidobacteria bacterium]|nr:hypothetical protein [Acidobacteriota bacterium]